MTPFPVGFNFDARIFVGQVDNGAQWTYRNDRLFVRFRGEADMRRCHGRIASGRVGAGDKRLRCGGRLFVIPRRVQHAVGLEVALEAGEHERPAFADRIEHLAAFGEVVVRDGELDLVLPLSRSITTREAARPRRKVRASSGTCRTAAAADRIPALCLARLACPRGEIRSARRPSNQR